MPKRIGVGLDILDDGRWSFCPYCFFEATSSEVEVNRLVSLFVSAKEVAKLVTGEDLIDEPHRMAMEWLGEHFARLEKGQSPHHPINLT